MAALPVENGPRGSGDTTAERRPLGPAASGTGRAAGRAAVQAAGPELRGGTGHGAPDRLAGRAGTGRRGARGGAGARLAYPGPARGRRRRQVVAVEIDAVLAASCRETRRRPGPGAGRPADRARRRRARVGQPDLPAAPTVLVANLPYNVGVRGAAPAGRDAARCGRGLVMVQAEVADRMCSRRDRGCTARPRSSWPVRGGAVGRDRAAQRILAGAERGFQAGRVQQARPARRRRAGSRCSR